MKTWKTTTIDEMEETAKNEETRDCSKKIRGEWLEIKWVSETIEHHFEYKWGKNFVSREVAANVLETAS